VSSLRCALPVSLPILPSSGDTPEKIGEASILLANTCFPTAHLDGGTGHDTIDVVCKPFGHQHFAGNSHLIFVPVDILFGHEVPSGVGDKTIDIPALKALGDTQAGKLAAALGV
jgi:chitosanase